MKYKPLNDEDIGKIINSSNCSMSALAEYENQLEEQCRRANKLADALVALNDMDRLTWEEFKAAGGLKHFHDLEDVVHAALATYLGEEDETL